jgi:hypothetical protein
MDDISKNDWAIVAKMAERVTKSKKWLSHWKSMDENSKIADEIEKWLSQYIKTGWEHDKTSKMADKI